MTGRLNWRLGWGVGKGNERRQYGGPVNQISPSLAKLLSNAIRIDVEAAGAKSKSRDDPPLTISTLRRARLYSRS